ncbi:MAG: hypothetical protein PUC05_06640, partial [Firmicutes bacterium]|nr:hypothetical protein [Bacillota bacterium]
MNKTARHQGRAVLLPFYATKKQALRAPTVKQFFINIKRDEVFSSLLHTSLPARYSVLYYVLFLGGKGVMF